MEFNARPLPLIQVIVLEQHLSDLLGVKGDLVEKRPLNLPSADISYRKLYQYEVEGGANLQRVVVE